MNKLPKIILKKKPTYLKIAQGLSLFELFSKIEVKFENCFILESLGEQNSLSRYSLVGFDPSHVIYAKGKNLYFDEQKYEVENPYFALREIVPQDAITKFYAGGLIGYLSYEAVNYFEPSLKIKEHPVFDTFRFGVFLDGLVLDKVTGELFYFFYDKNRLDLVKKIIKSNNELPRSRADGVSAEAESSSRGFILGASSEVFARNNDKRKVSVKFLGDTLDKKGHKQNVQYVLEQIRVGNTFQCEVGFKSEYKITGDSILIYENLRKINPSPFMYYLKLGTQKIIGASPELLFRLKNGDMETFPLAGTARRGRNKKEDMELARKLLNDPKEIAEHNMLVDLHRNDLGKVSKFGTVKVRSLMDIKKFSHVQHISSEISGVIKDGCDMFCALSSVFPAGTLTGAPKIESMKIINRIENAPRGPYGGTVGHFGFDGNCTFAIAIRSLFASGDYAFSQTSGGVVLESDPQKEYEEIENKLMSMRKALNI